MRVVVLTGAGISAESGVRTFRDSGGLWEGHDVEAVATPEGFARDRDLVQGFYDARRRAVAQATPNAAHRALVRLEEAIGEDLLVVTQNVDDLHERAGSRQVVHMHGELLRARCESCYRRHAWHADLIDSPPCPACAEPALRPDVVWFGEIPYELERIDRAVSGCDLFVSVGTSGSVYPAAGYVAQAASSGARTLELNLEPSEVSVFFDEVRSGPAARLVPDWVEQLVGAPSG